MADISKLPRPVADNWSWQLHAACRDVDDTVFFHPDSERGNARSDREDRAKRVCRTCPVIQVCCRYAITVQEPYGVWGGMSVDERAAVIDSRVARHTDDDGIRAGAL